MLRYSNGPVARTSSRPLRFLVLKGLDCFEVIIRVGEVRKKERNYHNTQKFKVLERIERNSHNYHNFLISIVLRTGKIIIMLLGGGYTELLWLIMGITGISVRTWIIMGIMGISVGEIIIENHLCNQRKKERNCHNTQKFKVIERIERNSHNYHNFLISIVLRTGKIIIMLLGGGYTELLWIIMGITGISVRIWLIMGISVRTWIIMRIMGISVRI